MEEKWGWRKGGAEGSHLKINDVKRLIIRYSIKLLRYRCGGFGFHGTIKEKSAQQVIRSSLSMYRPLESSLSVQVVRFMCRRKKTIVIPLKCPENDVFVIHNQLILRYMIFRFLTFYELVKMSKRNTLLFQETE